jgi:DNA-binding PadR family transcriptional regulator
MMAEMKRRVLCMFEQLGKETLDLHELFEAGGNDMDARKEVFYTVERLVEDGLLEERGNDFYALTAEGKRAAQQFRDD